MKNGAGGTCGIRGKGRKSVFKTAGLVLILFVLSGVASPVIAAPPLPPANHDTVAFDAAGGDLKGQAEYIFVPWGAKVGKPVDPVRTGYHFLSWRRQGGSDWDFNTMTVPQIVNHVIVLEAVWGKNVYQIGINEGLGGGNAQTLQRRIDETFTLPVPQRSGYTFTGWNTVYDAGYTLSGLGTGSPIRMDAMVINDLFNNDTLLSVTLFAQWRPNQGTGQGGQRPQQQTPSGGAGQKGCILQFYGNENTGGSIPVDGQFYPLGESVVLPDAGTLVRAGHLFAGWSEDSGSQVAEYKAGDDLVLEASMNLYAVWLKVRPGTDAVVDRALAVPLAGPHSPFAQALSAAFKGGMPLTDDRYGDSWAFVNLVAAVLGVFLMLFTAVRAAAAKLRLRQTYQGKVRPVMKAGYLTVHIALALAAAMLFLLTENMHLPVVLIDLWTVIMALIFIVVAVTAKLAFAAPPKKDRR